MGNQSLLIGMVLIQIGSKLIVVMKKYLFLILNLLIIVSLFSQNVLKPNKKSNISEKANLELLNVQNPSFVQMYYYDHNRVIEIVTANIFPVIETSGEINNEILSGRVHLWRYIAFNNTNFDTVVSINSKQQFNLLNNYVSNLLSNKSSNSNGVFAGTSLEYIVTIKDKQYVFKRRNYYNLYELLVN